VVVRGAWNLILIQDYMIFLILWLIQQVPQFNRCLLLLECGFSLIFSSPGFANVPIYFGSNVVGYYSVYPINIPANYVTSANDLNPNPSGPENYNVAKGYILIAQVLSVPSGSPGINVTPMPLPEPFMTGPWMAFETNDGGFNFDAIADNQVQFQMPSSALYIFAIFQLQHLTF